MPSPRQVKTRLCGMASILLGSLVSIPALALTVSEDFSTLARYSSATLVWNSAQGRLHPPLQVFQYQDPGFLDRDFSVGDGSHGEFNPSRYREFSVGGDVSGNVIRFDLSRFPVLNVTNFTLASGWTLAPVGDAPFIVRALGEVIIAGTLDCSGENGQDLNNDPTQITNGGAGHCGGGDGGAGASLTTPASSGAVGGAIITGGAGGGIDGPTAGQGATGTNSGGGGGGAYAYSRGAGFDPTAGSGATPGTNGEMGEDNDFEVSGGGFGGGGGSYFNAGAAAQNSAGGGGGGGGGYIFIAAAGSISITGQVLADGGDGGTASGAVLGGGGGGGGGGSIQLFAGGDVYMAGSGVVSAAEGLGRGPAGTEGGQGSTGRTWLVGQSGFSVLVPPLAVPEYPDPLMNDVGDVRYRLGTFTATSSIVDLANTKPQLLSHVLQATVPGGSSVTVEVASGADGSFTPSWVNVSTAPFITGRFAQFRVSVTNTDRVSPADVTSLNFNFEGFEQNEFQFVSACGGTSGPSGISWLLLPLLIFLLLRSPRYTQLNSKLH